MNTFRHHCEYIVWGTKGKCQYAGSYPGCFDFPVKQSDKFHLTGKPTLLVEELVKIIPEGSAVLDTFMGSGTTFVATRKNNRQFIGFEKTQVYYDVALGRLKQ